MMAYHGEFSSWADVQEQFQMDDPEPRCVIYAGYEQPPYEGYADVLYWVGGLFYYVSASHCSCYGLEGQWEPEAYTAEQLRGQVDRASYGFFHNAADIILAALPTSEEAGA